MKIKRHISKAKDKLLSTTIFEILRLIRKNKKISAIIILIDLIVSTIFYFTKSFIDNLGNKINYDFALIITILAYLIFALITYSFTKYLTIKLVTSFTQKTELNAKKFWRFLALNTILASILILAFFIITSLLDYIVKPDYIGITAYITIIVYAIISYIYANIAHFTFLKEQKAWKTIKEATKTLSKIKNYSGMIITSLAMFIIFYAIYWIIASTSKLLIFKTQQAYAINGWKYQIAITTLQAAFIYFLIFTNRIYFKKIADKTQ